MTNRELQIKRHRDLRDMDFERAADTFIYAAEHGYEDVKKAALHLAAIEAAQASRDNDRLLGVA